MIATSPNGKIDYENVVGWKGSLGTGVKPPEKGQATESKEKQGEDQI